MVSIRYVDTEVDRARYRSTINYRLFSTLSVGAEINPGEEEIGPLFTWFLVTERHGIPGLFLGTSSDRIGTDPGEQSYYLTAVKGAPWFPVSAWVTLNWSEADEHLKPEAAEETFTVPNHPRDPEAGEHSIGFSRTLWIERDDFMEDPPGKFRRLAPGREVRLRYAYLVTCTGVERDPETGEVTTVLCTHDPDSRGGSAPDGRKVKVVANEILDRL